MIKHKWWNSYMKHMDGFEYLFLYRTNSTKDYPLEYYYSYNLFHKNILLIPEEAYWPSDCISWLSFEARLTQKYIWNFLWFDRYLPKSCQEKLRKNREVLVVNTHSSTFSFSMFFHVNKVSGKIPPFNKLLLLNWHCTFLFVWSVVMDHQRNGGACFLFSKCHFSF